MQVFLPYPDIKQTAAVLDDRRLLKQLVECKQLITTDTMPNHPVRSAWRFHHPFLLRYVAELAEEWRRRGLEKRGVPYRWTWDPEVPDHADPPPFWGDDRFHLSHRVNLLRKDFSWYLPRVGGDVPVSVLGGYDAIERYEYLWPVVNDSGQLEGYRYRGSPDLVLFTVVSLA